MGRTRAEEMRSMFLGLLFLTALFSPGASEMSTVALDMGAPNGLGGLDYEFKCETTCELEEAATAASRAAKRSNAKQDFLDFSFMCRTTCQLVAKTGGSAGTATHMAFLELGSFASPQSTREQTIDEGTPIKLDGVDVASQENATVASSNSPPNPAQQAWKRYLDKNNLQAKASSTFNMTGCYRLCLNPKTNAQCQRSAQHVALIQMGEMSQEELMASLEPHLDTEAGKGGDCLATCVRVCTDKIPM